MKHPVGFSLFGTNTEKTDMRKMILAIKRVVSTSHNDSPIVTKTDKSLLVLMWREKKKIKAV